MITNNEPKSFILLIGSVYFTHISCRFCLFVFCFFCQRLPEAHRFHDAEAFSLGCTTDDGPTSPLLNKWLIDSWDPCTMRRTWIAMTIKAGTIKRPHRRSLFSLIFNNKKNNNRRKNKVVADLLFQHHAVFLASLQLTDLLSPNKVMNSMSPTNSSNLLRYLFVSLSRFFFFKRKRKIEKKEYLFFFHEKVARDTGTEWDIYIYTSGVSVCVCVYVWP